MRRIEMQKWGFALRFALPVLILFLVSPVLKAQYRAGIQGVVEDPTGAGIPGATLTLTDKDTGLVKTTTSDASGVYNFLSLAPGTYSIKVDATGFSSKTLAQVDVAAEQTQALNIQLSLGPVQQSVTVQGSVAPALNTENGEIGTTITNNQIQQLPAFGSDPFKLLSLAPGAFGDNEVNNGGGSQNTPGSAGPGGAGATASIFQTENQVQMNAAGQRNITTNFQIDGVDVNSLDWGGAAIITPNQESVKQVRVITNSYDASLGRSSGAQVEVVSQNGTNHLHGSAFFKMQRPGLNAKQGYNGPSGPTANERVTQRFNQEGGSLGGPIVRNHLFFFFSYETLRNASINTGTAWVETPQFLSIVGAQSGYIAGKLLSFPGEGASYTKVLPSTCAQAGLGGFPANCQPAGTGLDIGSPLTGAARGTLDPTFGATATPFGVGGGLDGIPDIQFVQYANPNNSVASQYNGRLDFQVTQSDLVAFTIYWVPNDSTFYNGQARAANLWHSDRLNYSDALLWNHVFGPNIINEARFNVSRWYFNELQSNPQEPWGLPLDSINALGSASGITYGSNGPGIFYKTNYNLRDMVTQVVGNHTMKYGVSVYREQNTQTEAGSARPDFNFQNLWDFANDAPVQESGNFDPQTGAPTSRTGYVRTSIWGVFFQDDYKMRPNLTVNLGLRWEYYSPLREKYSRLGFPVLGPAGSELTGLTEHIGGGLYNSQKANFGPQFGFAWSPTDLALTSTDLHNRLVIRGGYGLGFNRMEEAITLNPLSNLPFVSNFTFTGSSASDILYAVPSNTHQFNNWPVNPNAVLTFSPTTNLPTSGGPVTLDGIERNLPTPYTMRYSLEAQYDIGNAWIATVGYEGNESRHFTRQQNLNWQYAARNPAINNLYFWTNDANGDYNALLTEMQHHFSNTAEADFQYTYSRSMDDGSNDYYIGDYPFVHQADWGPSDYDVTNNIKLWAVWTPKLFGGSNNWMEKLAGGWTFSPIWYWHSGFPWTPQYTVQVAADSNTCSLIYSGSGYCTVRPAGYLGNASTSYANGTFERANGNFPGGAAQYFLPPTLSSNGIPPFPGVHRNSFRGPRYNSWNFTAGKAFGLPNTRVFGENAKLEIMANFYNLFNQINLTPLPSQTIGVITLNPNGTQTNPTPGPNGTNFTNFDQAQNGLAGRVVELQARFSF
jgi:hypothetical protein